MMMEKQGIDLPGIGNARELGGYRIKDKVIRRGVLLRTGKLDQAASEALQLLQDKYRLQTIVDFRMSTEKAGQSDPEIPGAEYVHLPVFEIEDMMDGADPGLVAFYMEHATDRMALFELSYEQKLVDEKFYARFLLGDRGKHAVQEFFRLLMELEKERAILWHCADGKDRTGCAAMLVLFALGADRELVLRDYLLTNEYNAPILEAIRAKVAPMRMPEDKLKLLLFMSGGVFPEYIDHAIDALCEHYGSVQGYLEEEIGLGKYELEKLKEAFLVTDDHDQ
ncbi:MAG: tyrosine-protein phosphatase, partial [Eubacterium sp.]|nr:tyrosine-protein phosphatase [Eubacterium sp.]